MRSARSFAIILVVHLVVIVLWQVLVDAFHVQKFILPSPLATVATLTSAKYAWLSNLAVTAAEILGGFCLGALVGVMLAVMFTWSPLISLLLLPLFVTLNMIPKVALGPLFIVWFSYGIFPNILIAFSICFFPILLTTARGRRHRRRIHRLRTRARLPDDPGAVLAGYPRHGDGGGAADPARGRSLWAGS